jgi:hypothetical protein
VIVAPLKLNHPAVFCSNPLKYGPGGASAAAQEVVKRTASSAAAVVVSLWILMLHPP